MKTTSCVLFMAAVCAATFGADVTGVWKAEFDTQIGVQRYTFEFKQDGERLTGKAISEIGGEVRESVLRDGSVRGERVRFVEVLAFGEMDLWIEYVGNITGDEIQAVRHVQDTATEDLVIRRVRDEAKAEPASEPRPQRRGGMFGPPPELGPDDKAAFEAAPAGFDVVRDEIARGKVETVEYESKTVGTRRKMLVYTPPGYSTEKAYPVLYLLHGIGGDETEWLRGGRPDVMFDNLYADKKVTEMIVVMPNGRAQKNDRAEGNVFASAPAFEVFERDLLGDVIPFVEANYPVNKDRLSRAIAGLSMGGGQSLNFGLGNPEVFAWVGGFSSAPNTKTPEALVPEPEKAKEQFKLIWISCGDRDGLMDHSRSLHRYLKEHDVPHIWHVDSGGHDFAVWKNDLYWFSQQLFRESKQ